MNFLENSSQNISVIIPAHDAEETIAETLDSLIAQTYSNWEAIIVDDGSTDRTGEISQKFVNRDSRFRLFHRTQGGEAAARNTGVEKAQNDWLLFLDSDDWIASSYLERMMRELISDSELDAVHCKWARVALDGTITTDGYQAPAGDIFEILARRPAFPVHACIVRKSKVESVGKFDTSLKKSPDWDLWQRIARTGAKFGAVPELLAFYRMRPTGASMDAFQLLVDDLRILKQGHSPDARVLNPHPDHIQGLPPDQISNQVFYLLSWCAGILIGSGKDARPLLDLVKEYQFPELYPESVAQCIFDSAPLPNCQSPGQWEDLARAILLEADEFLMALEDHAKAKGLARKTGIALRKMILNSSWKWRPVIEAYESRIDELKGHSDRLVAELDTRIQGLEKSYNEQTQKANHLERDLKELEQTNLVLEKEKESTTQERNEWRRTAEERNAILSGLRNTKWLRFGFILGILNDPMEESFSHSPRKRAVRMSLRYFALSGAILVSALQGIYFLIDRSSNLLTLIAVSLAVITSILVLGYFSTRRAITLRLIQVFYGAQVLLFLYRLLTLPDPYEFRLIFVTVLIFHILIAFSIFLGMLRLISRRTLR